MTKRARGVERAKRAEESRRPRHNPGPFPWGAVAVGIVAVGFLAVLTSGGRR